MDSPSKLEKILRGMNALSGEIPITVKIRTGTKDGKPNAISIAERLLLGGYDSRQQGLGGAGIAAITLHGRSRQQRYTGPANWSYISQVAHTVQTIRNKVYDITDTVHQPDARHGPAGNGGHVFFIGNGDVYSHTDYYTHLDGAQVDSVMIGRGALIKPWIFREIEAKQHLDPSSSDRLTYISDFVRYGLSAWGADERGIGTTRRFLLEWLSFTHRYIPTGLLETLPPKINERAPAFRGRNELETLMASDNYKDWIKISDMFLGPTKDDFKFVPKHKSNSYEMEAEG
jgi:tRNA-dihydrouridine synthase 3